jgi:molecular chaperone DnaK
MKTIGIDLGTTNTVAAVDGKATRLGAEGSAILPSVVAYPPSGVTLVGTPARRRRTIDVKNCIFSAKRVIGKEWHAERTQEFRKRYPFDTVCTDDGRPGFRTRAGVVTAEDVAAAVLSVIASEVRGDGEDLGAVVTVPSEFGLGEREATTRAARKAGFGDVRILDEAVATAVAYRSQRSDVRTAAVYDLGGGTFDLAIVDCAGRPFQVIGQLGDQYLGGDDVDRTLAEWAADTVLAEHRWDLRSEPEVFDRLVLQCERAKIRLSYGKETKIELAQIDPSSAVAERSIILTQSRMMELCTHLVRRTFVICDEVLRKAGIKAAAVDAVYLAGGSTQLPSVRAGVEQYFGKPVHLRHDPMEVVAIGASRAER